MNLVAHQVLSFDNQEIQIGNFLGEFVKGKKYEEFSPSIIKGILLHRSIDTFTDSNEIVKLASKIFHKNHGKFSPIIVDVLFDYFLIKHWNKYRQDSYLQFIKSSYLLLNNYQYLYTPQIKMVIEYLIKQNWFLRYSTLSGIERTLLELGQRTKYKNNMKDSMKDIYLHELELEQLFLDFYPDLEKHCKDFLGL